MCLRHLYRDKYGWTESVDNSRSGEFIQKDFICPANEKTLLVTCILESEKASYLKKAEVRKLYTMYG
ncbi:unnamed protein product [Clonostachys solani]|uniref:Uncharacterized protein n=1 Tax=Clonostachys solani TaxID=160281 RepID=A0A9N9ZJ14_9HYPO|nr:unnamed protein product [Clonostachys solani]